ncbi:MAG: stage II sporulation protein R [Bacillales bacterium]|nr:stage II sporulation protein R [Bacillales bacterium]
MKKYTAVFYLLILSMGTIFSLYIPKQETAAEETVVIPDQAIRLRILANSDKPEDQAVKRKIRDEVNAHINLWVKDLTSISQARKVIKSKLPEIQNIASRVMEEEGIHQSVKVEYGKHISFPTKLYGQYLYPAGEYEAILITLGEGKGANWWCVLYPPLCFLDFSNSVAVRNEAEANAGVNEKKEKAEKRETEKKKEDAEAPPTTVDQEDDLTSAEKDKIEAAGSKEETVESGSRSTGEDRKQPSSLSSTYAAGQTEIKSELTKHNSTEVKETKKKQEEKPIKKSGASKKKTSAAPVYAGDEEKEKVKVHFLIVDVIKKFF